VKLATIRTAGGTAAVRLDGDILVGLGAKDLGAFLAVPHWREAAAATSASAPGAVTYSLAGTDFAEIERGAALAAGTLVDWARVSAEMLAQAMDELAPGQWGSQVVTAQGRTVPAAEVPWMRAREVWVHAVDLGTATTFGDLPADFLAALTEEIRLRRGLDALPGGPLLEVAAWLAGRPHALAGAPALGPWL
jgi:maleylpyruvate isomerase